MKARVSEPKNVVRRRDNVFARSARGPIADLRTLHVIMFYRPGPPREDDSSAGRVFVIVRRPNENAGGRTNRTNNNIIVRTPPRRPKSLSTGPRARSRPFGARK